MGEPYLGEVKIVAFGFPPKGWAFCNGSLLPISQNQALFSILGTMYGGNGTTNFALPNFQGRSPVHLGGGFIEGQSGGETSHTLTLSELAAHAHSPVGTTDAATSPQPGGNLWAQGSTAAYGPTPNVVMAPASVQPTGGGQPHENMSPYLVLNFIIALQGIFPTAN